MIAPVIEEMEEVNINELEGNIPPIFGKCPVCSKPLRPRDKDSDIPKAPPVGQGYFSRAKCDGCGTVIEYIGRGEWQVYNGD